mmetsp:Transcript_649/g.1070  ORF Transcript_649/g.1070 Transcript_649/m.1070 type:complete len:227 (-) Transcript_649:372-1052(-)
MVQLEGSKAATPHGRVLEIQRSNTNDGPLALGHVELNHVGPEEHITDQQSLHAWRTRLDAGLVGPGQKPRGERDLPLPASNLEPEGLALLPKVGEIIERNVVQLSPQGIPWHDQARGPRVHDRGKVLSLLHGGEIQELLRFLEIVPESQGGDADDEVILRETRGVPHLPNSGVRVITSQLHLRIRVRREERELAGQVPSIGHLVLSIGHGKENRSRKLPSLLPRLR